MHAGYYIVRQVPLRYCFLGIFALLAFLGFRLSAQENTDKREQVGVIRIHGFIKDRGGEPISLASIRVVGKAIGAVSDLKGAYSFTLYPHSDSLTIETSCIGYKSVSKNLPNGVKQDTRIDFTLPDANLILGAVTVTASSSKQKSNMETVKAEHCLLYTSDAADE